MHWLTEDARLTCAHETGFVDIAASQSFVRIGTRRVLVARDPEGRTINGCLWISPGMKRCDVTLPVIRGYSNFIRIGGRAVCLDTVEGLTDGTPPGTFIYNVRLAGQSLVSQQ